MKIRKNDQVLIAKGKDRGKRGKVLDVFPKIGRIVVEGINMRKKNAKPKRTGEKGQIIHVPASFSAANAVIVCPKCGQPARIGHKIIEKKKYRVCKKCNSEF